MIDPTDNDEAPYFAYSAVLRIHGDDLPLDAISSQLGIAPSHQHRRGESHRADSAHKYRDDAWHLSSSLPEGLELTLHLREVWRMVEPHVEYLRALDARVDVFCGYRSNNGGAGFAVEPDALAIFTALQIPFGISIIIDGYVADMVVQ